MSGPESEPGLASNVGVLQAMSTQRAVRHLRRDPVPRQILESIVFHATRAASAANRQPWEFVVVTDSTTRKSLGEIYKRASRALFESLVRQASTDAARRVYRDALYLSDHLGDAPAIILVSTHVTDARPLAQQLGSIYPAVQNLMLAARAYGLGCVLTTAHKREDDDLRRLLAIPNGVETVCLIPVGYPEHPDRAFRAVDARRPTAEVLHWDTY
jgi:nitroreductase